MQHAQGRFDVSQFQACIGSPIHLKGIDDVAIPLRLTGTTLHSSPDNPLYLFTLLLEGDQQQPIPQGRCRFERAVPDELLLSMVPNNPTQCSIHGQQALTAGCQAMAR